jgi:hypothetical protein
MDVFIKTSCYGWLRLEGKQAEACAMRGGHRELGSKGCACNMALTETY